MLWYSGFTRSGCFSGCPQPGSFDAKSADVESSYTSDAYARWNSAGDVCARGVSVIGTCTRVAGLRGPCIGSACVGSTSAGGA